MRVVQGLFTPLPKFVTPVATLGAFDGVHRGHERILAETVAWARELDAQSLAVTFDPLPKAIVGQGGALCLTSLPHRLALLERSSIGLAVVLPFDETLAEMPAERFVRDVLLDWLGARHLVFGRDSTFGRSAEGNLELLRRLEAAGLLRVRSPRPVLWRGKPISSTAIRQAIGAGDLRAAAAMLGRPVSLLGTVVPGDGRGRSLGFPTANLDLHHEAVPPDGVYAAVARIGSEAHPALTYIGRRPTFETDPSNRTIEVHLIGLDQDLYGRDIEVQFLKRLRGDARFPSAEALVAQMKADRQAALRACRRRLRADPRKQ
jgi:riboflavin kinase/FMN adenylyltransferase